MMMMMVVMNMKSIVWLVVLWAAIQWLVSEKLLRLRRRLPPGPTAFPIIGNLHNLITKNPHKILAELAKIHGPVMLLRLGFRNTVVVSSPEMAREILQKKDAYLCDKMAPHCFSPHIAGNGMWLMPANDRWRTLRKIGNTLLFTSKSLDANTEIRMKKIKDLVSSVSRFSEDGVPVKVGQVAFDTNMNLISNTLFSLDLADQNSPISREFKQVTWELVRDAGKPNIADFYPVFNRFDLQRLQRRMTSHFEKTFDLFRGIIDERLCAIKNGAPDGIDVLGTLLRICLDKSEDLQLSQIPHMFADFFIGGTETTSSTIEWAMAELIHNPTTLKAATEELHRVIGRGNFVQEADLGRLPYLQAVMKETMRLHPSLPMLVPRKPNSEIEVHGFMLPKDSQVTVNVWAIGRDPSRWKNPNDFEPERFINCEIDVKGTNYELLPFGGGRRICLGIPLATRILPLMLANLISFFDWELEDGVEHKDMDMEEDFGLALNKAIPLYAIPKKFTT